MGVVRIKKSPASNIKIQGELTPPTIEGGLTDNQDIVNFNADAVVHKGEYPTMASVPVELLSCIEDDNTHDIKSFLERPCLLKSGVLAITDTANLIKETFEVPSQIITDIDVYKEKLKGFLGFRADLKIRLQVNGQRFQQGRYFLHYIPQGQYTPARTYTCNLNLTLKTQQPRMEIDISTQQEVEMVVPYVSPTLFFDLITGEGDMGLLYLSCYSPLVSPAGSTVADYSIWVSFENITLFYPTVVQGFVAQGPSETEARRKGVGPVSGVLSKVAKAANIMGEIPMLSAFMGPVSWASDIFGRAATVFGFSNPKNQGVSNFVTQKPYSNSVNVDGVDNSIQMSLLESSTVQNLPGFAGTNVDEMDFSYFLSRPAFYFSLPWTTSTVVGNQLGSINVSPTGVYSDSVITSPPGVLRSYMPMGYMSRYFRFWRGSIKLVLKFVKTEFHSGRIQVTFIPGATAGATYTLAQLNYAYKEIVDLRTSNVFEINIPYVYPTPWCDRDAITGVVTLHVVNALVAPATVSSGVSILMEFSGGSDLEFSFPDPKLGYPTLVNTAFEELGLLGDASVLESGEKIPSLVLNDEEEVIEDDLTGQLFTAQILLPSQAEGDGIVGGSDANYIGGSTMKDSHLAAAIHCTGEAVSSIRQLVKRACVFFSASGSAVTDIVPSYMSMATYAVGTGFFFRDSCETDLYTYFGSCYAYKRGGVRFKIYSPDPTKTTDTIRASLYYSNNSSWSVRTTYDAVNFCRTVGLSSRQLTNGIEVEIPQYSQTHILLNSYPSGSASLPYAYYSDQRRIAFRHPDTTETIFLRSAADDCSFGFFIGVPPVALITDDAYVGPW